MTDRYENLALRMECSTEEIPVLIQKHFPWNGREACDCVLEKQKENEDQPGPTTAALLDAERENTALRQQVAELTALGASLHKAAAAGRDSERAAVVAWLYRQHYDDTATRIERGEHRRGEGG